MNMKPAGFSLLVSVGLVFSLQAHAQCSNASMNGTFFGTFGGSVANGSTTVAHQDLGKIIADGNGGFAGQATTSIAGVLTTQAVTGTYSIKSNCSGTGALSSNGISVQFTLQLVNGGSVALASVTSSTVGQIGEGRFYRAANSNGSVCGTGTVAGTYGVLLSGGTYAAAIRTPYDAVNQTTLDGNGGVTVSGEVTTTSGSGTNFSGTGTYTIAADCSGTAQVTTSLGTVNYALARIEGGAILLLETDANTTIAGTASPQQLQQIVPQIAFGGGWYSALYFTNTTSISQTFVVTFTADDGTPLNIPGVGTTRRVTLAPQATTIIEALNAGALTQGYAAFSLPSGVTGYGVSRQSVPGIADQEALVGFKSATGTATSFTWDDTNFITALAFVNTSSVPVTATITAWSSTGTLVGSGTVTLAAGKKFANTLRGIAGLSGVAGLRGSALVTVPTGSLALLGLRFYGSAFTTIPTTLQQ